MKYLLLIYDSEAEMDPAQRKRVYDGYMAFDAELKASGSFVAGDALKPTSTATSVRKRDGSLLTTDGPFAETTEALGGYYLVDCKDLDEALRWAAKIPTAETGTIEVRPIMELM